MKKITINQIEDAIQRAKNLLSQGLPPSEPLHFLLENNIRYRYRGIKHFEEFCLFCFDCTVEALQKIYLEDKHTLGLITQALKIKHQGWNTNLYPVAGFKYRPAGTSRDAALRRLKNNRPDLYQKVIDGELSANAAAIAAGFRKKK